MTKLYRKIGKGSFFLLFFTIGIFMVGCTAMQKNEDRISPEIVSEAGVSAIEEKANEIDYLNSQDSVELQIVAQTFAKAYFSGDLVGVKLYLVDKNSAEVYESNIYNNLEYLILKWSPKDIATKTTIGVSYQFLEKGTDSATYLGLSMKKISNEWKVLDFVLEK